jgi:alkanesulfonate monooxygenase SsuD/methylene tetrahydromethanopterin reductase-like flavin-dependent oxidoreductase (luciferase family)
MKVSIWCPVEYAAEGLPRGWPAPGKWWEPARGTESMTRAFELFDLAVSHGFEMVTTAEHHYGYGSLVPSPNVMAAALAQRYPEVKIGILGPILPLSNPVRVAEEIAMVDVLSGGRTVVGMFRGIPTEHLVYGVNPAETADIFREALALVVRAWTEPETFGWEGRHYRFQAISAWPRPLQRPHPPLVFGATTPESARLAAARGYILGVFAAIVPPDAAAEIAGQYREAAAGAGRSTSPEDVLYRARIYVASTDEEAEQDVQAHGLGDIRSLMAPAPERAEAAGKVLAALFGGGGSHRLSVTPRPEFCGSPATVASQLLESSDRIGWGILDAKFTDPRLPHEKAKRSLELFVTEVLPHLRQDVGATHASP